MDELRYAYKKTGRLDHAYLLAGDIATLRVDISNFLSKDLGIKIENNIDCLFEEYNSFGIGESRHLKEIQANKGFNGVDRYFIISTSFFSNEAQNALLKIFEEPREGVYIFLIVPTVDIIIDTLHSRLQVINTLALPDSGKTSVNDGFIDMPIKERLKIVKDIIPKKNAEPEERELAKIQSLALLDSIEEALAKKNKYKQHTESANALREVIFARKYLYGRSPSLKMILEHLALVVPSSKSYQD